MRIKTAQILNYKSFLDSGEIQFAEGFNVIVGQNNVGKSALAQALASEFENRGHHSLQTAPTRGARHDEVSRVKYVIELTGSELRRILGDLFPSFRLPVQREVDWNNQMQEFINMLARTQVDLEVTLMGSKGYELAEFREYRKPHADVELTVAIEPPQYTFRLLSPNIERLNTPGTVSYALAQLLFRERVYLFKAERLNVSQSAFGIETVLSSDASNLPQVLNNLQSNNFPRFRRFNQLVSRVFPEVTQIGLKPISNNSIQIRVWGVDPATEREDLTVSLSESGTGIGQVLAILYVVITSEYPRTIIIDEPQSFLHPGAIRVLFEILRRQFPQHQYIVTTHSPNVITASNPSRVLLIKREEGVSRITGIDANENSKMQETLSAVGARLADVFGADSILWVEGPTEEYAFPLILAQLPDRLLGSAKIVGVINTGDFDKKDSDRIIRIYRKLSRGQSLLPPAVGFIFDLDGRTEQEQSDLRARSGGTVYFLNRRMYENYLLHPAALAAVMSGIDGFRSTRVTTEEVQTWLVDNHLNPAFYERDTPNDQRTQEHWIRTIHAGNFISALFSHLSDKRVDFDSDKVEYDKMLTDWILENDPSYFQEIATLLGHILPT